RRGRPSPSAHSPTRLTATRRSRLVPQAELRGSLSPSLRARAVSAQRAERTGLQSRSSGRAVARLRRINQETRTTTPQRTYLRASRSPRRLRQSVSLERQQTPITEHSLRLRRQQAPLRFRRLPLLAHVRSLARR